MATWLIRALPPLFHRLYGNLPQFAACSFVLAVDREHSCTPPTECSKQELSSDLSTSPAPTGEAQIERGERRGKRKVVKTQRKTSMRKRGRESIDSRIITVLYGHCPLF